MSTTAPERPPAAPISHSDGGDAIGARRVGRLAIIMFPARAFLALGWIRAGAEKLIDTRWWAGDYITNFLADHEESMLSIMAPVTELIGVRVAALLALVVLLAEFAIGVCLITGRFQRQALWAACALNVSFVALGAVSPSAFYLVLQMTLLLALASARRPASKPQTSSSVGGWIIAALAMLPFITTLHPHEVIDDPAIMLATLAALRAATLTVLAVEHG